MDATRYAPRNPNVKAPDLEDIVGSGAVFGPEADIPCIEAKVWRNKEVPPSAPSFLASGHLTAFAQGLIFLPDNLSFDPDLMIRIAKGASEYTVSKLVEAALATGGEFAGNVAENLVGLWLEGKDDQRQAVKSFEELFRHPSAFLIPYVEVVETSRRKVQKWWRSTDYSVITLENTGGERKSYCITYVKDELLQYTNAKLVVPHLPGIIMKWRFARELEGLLGRIRTEAIDEVALLRTLMEKYDAPETQIIAMLSLLVKLTTGSYDDVAKNLVESYGASDTEKYLAANKGFELTVGEFVGFVDDYNNACRKQYDEKGLTPQYIAAAMLERLAPLLNDYKRVQVMAHHIEVIEAVARGEPDPNWTPSWTPEY